MNMPADPRGPVGPGGAVPMEIPDLKKPDLQMLMQDNAAARREVFEARRETQKRVEEERERARYEIERVRTEAAAKQKKADLENDALIVALGRLREENDTLRQENLVLRIGRANGSPGPSTELLERAEPKMPSKTEMPSFGRKKVEPLPMFPMSEPQLGRTMPIDPTKL